MRWVARYKLKQAIKEHERQRQTLLYIKDHGICLGSPNHNIYVNDMSHRAECEWRCAERLKVILNRYQ